jgi:hypothetical protein
MIRAADVLMFLVPDSKWYIYGNDYEGITFVNDIKVTKEEFEAGFAQYETWKIEQDIVEATKKTALLAKLGITADEARLLLGGN